jgi:hypothetical protein
VEVINKKGYDGGSDDCEIRIWGGTSGHHVRIHTEVATRPNPNEFQRHCICPSVGMHLNLLHHNPFCYWGVKEGQVTKWVLIRLLSGDNVAYITVRGCTAVHVNAPYDPQGLGTRDKKVIWGSRLCEISVGVYSLFLFRKSYKDVL